MESIINHVYLNILHGQQKEVVENIQAALKQGVPPISILHDGMISAMNEVGRLFESGEYYIPEMLVSARAMQAGMNVLKRFLTQSEVHPAGKVAIGTVEGDYHDIGKNLVKMMLEGSGFEVIDLGVDVNPSEFMTALIEQSVDIIAMSALITTTMPAMQPVIELLNKSGLRQKVIVIVGGAPLTEEFAHQIGADGYAPDASQAVTLSKSLLENE